MIKSCKRGMQITTSEETTPNQFVYSDTLNTCLAELDRGFYFHFLLNFNGFLIFRDKNNDTPAGICDGI